MVESNERPRTHSFFTMRKPLYLFSYSACLLPDSGWTEINEFWFSLPVRRRFLLYHESLGYWALKMESWSVVAETYFIQKLSEDSGSAILNNRKNTLIKRIHGTAYAEADSKPFSTILGTSQRAIIPDFLMFSGLCLSHTRFRPWLRRISTYSSFTFAL